jgi:nitrogen fixation/metabolism regulation signal transduction histidine kinase
VKFGTKVILLVAATAVVPLATSVVLVELALRTGENIDLEHDRTRDAAIERAITAYNELFQARKAQFRSQAAAIACAWNGAIDDPDARFIRRWSVEPNGPSGGGGEAAFPEDKWRGFEVPQPLKDGRTLKIEFVAQRERFQEFEAIGTLAQWPQIEHLRAAHHQFYHWIFLALFSIVFLPLTAGALWVARRTTRRLEGLAAAARSVGAGDLGVRVRMSGRDEIGELARAFDDMVGELSESRARIAYLEKIGAWQEVARRLAHEIKNPLTPIQLAVQQLHRSYGGDDPRFRKLLDDANEIVGEEVGTLRRLVEDFSAFARLPRVAPAPLDLGELVADVVRGHPEWVGKVRAGALDEPLELAADRQLLRRALVNLVENALQAGARMVTVRAERATMPRRARIIVDDDGPGVAPELQMRIFEPYFTTKEHGTGLGLAIVRKIALEHGGDVTVGESAAGGARFVIELPDSTTTKPGVG